MKNRLIWGVVLYFVLNILVTYLVSSVVLNPNIVAFETDILHEISAIIGNFAILLLFLVIGLICFKRKRPFYRYIIVVTFLLNVLIALLGYFTRSFKTMLSFYNLSLFRNPNAGFAYQIVLDGLSELLNSIQILSFVPTIILVITYIIFRKSINGKLIFRFNTKILLLLISLVLSLSTILFYKYELKRNWIYRTEVASYGVDTCGVYNYYFAELVVGIDYTKTYYNEIKENEDNLYMYNNTNLNSSVLEGMNLFIIQAEALQNFVISFEYNDSLLTPYLNQFINEENVFYFDNVHTVVGIGNTSDAEFAVNTGFYPTGDLTIFWEVYDKLFEIQSLPKMFGDDYICYSFNPTIEGFYAHKYIHENWLGFDLFSGFETFESTHLYSKNEDLYLHQKWVSDKAMLEYSLEKAVEVLEENKHFYIFSQTISPHYPFVDLEKNRNHEWINFPNLSGKFNNYLNQINYNDKMLYEFILEATSKLPNTVFVIYGDHGNTLSKVEFEKLYNKKMTDLEYREMMLEIPVIIYDPSGKISNYLESNLINFVDIKNRTLSQIDIFTTIKNLFNLEAEYALGVNMFSKEKSFAIDPKVLDIITDEFIYNVKSQKYCLKNISYDEMIDVVDEIKKFKLENDCYITKKLCS